MAKKKFYETDAFKREQKEWYAKLATIPNVNGETFVDIENGKDDAVIKPQIIKTHKSQYDGGNTYYELCQEILREYKFRKDIHRVIFELHATGQSERDICNTIKSKYFQTFSQKGINLLINRVKDSYLKGAK